MTKKDNAKTIERIKEENFAARFKDIHENDLDAKFCFILGAGASRASGIRTGQQLATLWLKEINELKHFINEDIQAWKKTHNIDEKHPELCYGEIYAKRFSDYRDLGYKMLGKEMANKQPSFGYSVLAQMMANERHNVVITTNFDNLTEAAMYTFTNKKPVVCGHESLAGYASPSQELPLIVKIHRDLLFHPKNEKKETDTLAEEWVEALNKIFSTHIPIFIGYGGNDGSLMNYLNELDPVNKMYWCLYKDELPANRIENVVLKHNGIFVETNGFDSVFHELHQVLKYKYAFYTLQATAKGRETSYLEQIKKIQEEKQVKNPFYGIGLTDNSRSKTDSKKQWWVYELKASSAKTIEEKDAIYKEGLAETNSSELIGSYAIFLSKIRKEYDLAEKHYKKALDLDPYSAAVISNYALFLNDIRKDYNQAEKYYEKALNIDPDNPIIIGNYANLLFEIRKNYDLAEKFYKKSLEIDPSNPIYNGNYASLISNVRKDYERAEKYHKKALELNPNDPIFIGNYANFLFNIRKEYDLAEKFYKSALKIDSKNAANNGNYASLLSNIRKDFKQGEKHFKKALQINPDDRYLNSNYAQLLLSQGRKKESIEYINKALENCKAEDLLLELSYYQYAHFIEQKGKQALEKIKLLLQEGARTIGWHFDGNMEQAKKENHPNLPLLKELAKVITTQDSEVEKVITIIDKELKRLT